MPRQGAERFLNLAEGKAAVEHEGLGGDFRGDVGVAVAVAAHPGAEGDPAFGRLDAGVGLGQRALEFVAQEGDGLPEDGVEIPEAGADFVGDFGPGGAGAVGEPKRGDFAFEHARVFDAGDFVFEERAGILQAMREALQLGEHGASLGFGGVRGEDELDVEFVEERLDGFRRDVAGAEFAQGGADRFAHRGRAGDGVLGAAALAQKSDAVRFLGKVDELEVDGEGHGHLGRLGGGEYFDGGAQVGFGLDVAGAAAFGQEAQFFLEVEDGFAFEFDDDFAEDAAQTADFRREGVGGAFRR